MRTAYTTFTLAALLLTGAGAFAQTGFTLVTGPTSFTGASNLEDGIQVASVDAFQGYEKDTIFIVTSKF